MKKIIFSILCCIMLVLTSCNKDNIEENGINIATEYLASLNSYELNCDMTINRANKNVKMEVDVQYLNPNYYKVCFKNANGHEQLIVKNDDGVFVLTPSLNKEFKFDSEWPLNSSHAYLLAGICNDIKSDGNSSFSLDGKTVVIESKLANTHNTATKLKFYYDSEAKKPTKAVLLDDNNNEQVKVEFNEFTPNKELSKDKFNTKLIMEEKSNQTESTTGSEEEEAALVITCGYVCDGATLSSSKIEDDCTILCYSGTKSYTVVVEEADVYSSTVIINEFNTLNYLEAGLLLTNENLSKFYIDDLEVSIYSNNLSVDEIIAVASDITLS